jgi:hypothetical protein
MGLKRLLRFSRIGSDNTIPSDADTVCYLLSQRRRRRIVRLLDAEGEPVHHGELATEIATLETKGSEAPSAVYETVYTSLYQTHLPALDEANIVDWNQDTGVVQPLPCIAPLADIISSIEKQTEGGRVAPNER